jgi:hypothetical protein
VQLSQAVAAVGALEVVEVAAVELRVMEQIQSQRRVILVRQEPDLAAVVEMTVVQGES